MDDQNKMISIFDFLEDSNDCAIKNIDTGTIDFYDHFFDNVLIPKIFNLNNFQYIKDLSYYTLSNVLKLVRKNHSCNHLGSCKSPSEFWQIYFLILLPS